MSRPLPTRASSRRVPPRVRDDRGSAMITVLLVLVMFVPMALAIAAIVVNRQKDLVFERSRTVTAHVAEAGIDGATAALRAATKSTDATQGARTKLPCADATPIQGRVGAQAPALRYAVQIRYYAQDPRGQDEAWRQAQKLTCTPGQGLAVIPGYALMESAATGSQVKGSFAALRERSVEAVYRFAIGNVNLDGGLVHTRTHLGAGTDAGAVDLCWAAAATPATPGTAIVMAECTEGDPAQLLAYRADYTLHNAASDLCITAEAVAGTPATLQPCTAVPAQRWTYDADDMFRAVDATGTALVGLCLDMATAYQPGTAVVLTAGCSGPARWSPDQQTGTGGAGAAQYQLVNFAQFARCFDVTNGDLNASFTQVHPCKQNASGPLNFWPQQVTWDPAKRTLEVGRPDSLRGYCLTSSGTEEGVVTTKPCAPGGEAQKWTVTGQTASYATSYTIVDSQGRCMAAGAAPTIGWTYSAIVTATCDGSTVQKWNAPADFATAGTEGFRETTG